MIISKAASVWDFFFCSYRAKVISLSLMGPWTTEEALFLIKAKGSSLRLCLCFNPSECMFLAMQQLSSPSEGGKEQVNNLTFGLTWLLRACGHLSKVFTDDYSISKAAHHMDLWSLNWDGFLYRLLVHFWWTMQDFCLPETNQAIQFSGFQNGMQKNSLGFR